MTNCFDYICPKCGNTDEIDVCAEIWIRMTSDGTDADASENGDHIFDGLRPAQCCACRFEGKVDDFDPESSAEKKSS